MTVTRGSRYTTQAYCGHCGEWFPQARLLYDERGSPRCFQCGRRVRVTTRRQFEKEKKGRLESFLESVKNSLAF